jgi:hypothetical protein
MRVLRPSATTAPTLTSTLLLLFVIFGLTSLGFAAEIAELRNGFTIPHRSREFRDGLVRLYMDEAKKSFVDLPVEEIQSYSSQPDPEPAPATLTQPQPEQAASAASTANTSAASSNNQAPAVPANTGVPSKSTDQIVREASETHGVDSDFIHSVIQQESAGNPHAVSRTGARGLMQLMPGTAAQLGVEDSFSPEQNVHGGARYLRELLERYHGDAIKALAAYNAGPGAVDRYRGVPPYRETRAYVRRVVREYNRKKNGEVRRPETAQKAGGSTRKTLQANARPGDAPNSAADAIPAPRTNSGQM